MSSRTFSLFALACALVALATPAVQADPARQCAARPVCAAPAPTQAPGASAPKADFLLPARSTAVAPDLNPQYIGQCCTNNDSSLCPPVSGYTTVYCAFPMCGAGVLSCVYTN
jgi:hypothetical protein